MKSRNHSTPTLAATRATKLLDKTTEHLKAVIYGRTFKSHMRQNIFITLRSKRHSLHLQLPWPRLLAISSSAIELK
jgi:hypothetical protein